MPSYSQVTLSQFLSQLGTNLDDTSSLYWTDLEKTYAVQEGLRVFGALTSYWRTRGTFGTAAGTTYYDLSVQVPALRTRTWTLQQLTQEIQFALLEAANGISGVGMSEQVTVTNILQAIQRARNRWVIDTRLPLTVIPSSPGPASDGLVGFDQSIVYLHRAAWQDSIGRWTNLWREDAWAVDHGSPGWTTTPGAPTQYSEAELAPLQVQLSPPPVSSGILEILAVESLSLDLTNPAQTFDVPDEWSHALKYAALADIFGPNSQIGDTLRANYCEQRYAQAVSFARDARSLFRVLVNGTPCAIDSLVALDAGQPSWRNQVGTVPNLAGCLYDILAFSSTPYGTAGVSVDVSQSAPIPVLGTDFIPLGSEDLEALMSYCTHVLTLKCGGKELLGTMPDYDDFMRSAGQRMGINKAKIRYLEPLFGIPNREWAARPDKLGTLTQVGGGR